MDAPDLMLPQEAADFLRLQPERLRDWRSTGRGPRYVKRGRLVAYRRSDLIEWLDQQTVNPRNA